MHAGGSGAIQQSFGIFHEAIVVGIVGEKEVLPDLENLFVAWLGYER